MMNNNHQGMQGIHSSSLSSTTTQANASTSNAMYHLGMIVHWTLLLICIIFIILGFIAIANGNKNNSDETTDRGTAYIRYAVILFLIYTACLTIVSLFCSYPTQKVLLTLLVIGTIAFVMYMIPLQFVTGINKSLFFDWFEDTDIEQSMLKSFNSLHLIPIGLILLCIILTVIILIL